MPTPDDVASGAVKYLSTFSDLTALIGSFPLTDTNPGTAGMPYIFKDDILVTMEGSSSAAIVCSLAGGWAVPNPMTTPRFMRLGVTVYIDPQRDASNNVTETSGLTKQRGQEIFNVIQNHLHRTDPNTVLWGDLRTVGCQLLSEAGPWSQVTDGDWLLSAQAFYGVLVFGAMDAVV